MATIDDEARPAPAGRAPGGGLRKRLVLAGRRLGRAVSSRAASSLTRRIVVLNLGGLFALFVGFLYLNQFREGLIEARVQSLLTQGEIIAGAIAASATVDTDAITIDPDKLLQMQAGESAGIAEDPLDFSINPEKVAPLLRRLVTPTKTRARVYDRDGMLTIDSRSLYSRGEVLRLDLPRVGEPDEPPLLERTWNMLRNKLGRADVPTYDDFENANGKSYPEVARALSGAPASVVRVNTRGQTIVSVAVPVQRFRAIKGALLLSTQGGDIDAVIGSERFAIFQVFAVAAAVMIVLSVLLAGTIAEPIRKLADAAQRVRRGVKSREQIPDFSSRHDEIGHLSGSLREMTEALYSRIEAIESFAADVAHELKNPLTSLRSAVETLPRAKNDESRGRLMAVIQHDVRRLDRLISDISDASRLDAELARNDSAPVDVAQVLEAVTTIQNETRREGQARIELTADRRSQKLGDDAFFVLGHDSRIGQVMVNLIDNARSFSPPDKPVKVTLSRVANDVLVTVEDEGPGIEPHALERVFERFYTDRPNEGFGQNSGLGLSISRQIIEAHRGSIRAENRLGPPGPDGEAQRLGARFIVRLPAAHQHAA
ncbi:sensor histidine kinase [Bosea sp. TND4EK4]|uniref:sensor histidine kinase n=1 Tax=Bosea sp. TND4EK4 TaxID=1907408 RepID=UPI000955B905|nr:sensor histidine kinase [Bosea sp. TND4EK4]SIQ88688.1 two-component system, OmpR family, sensor histidine kinase ChvG [Bosea sp. TND4EK4]